MKNAFDIVLLLSCIFGVDQGWQENVIRSVFSWAFRALNLTLIATMMSLRLTGQIPETKGIINVINAWGRDIYLVSLTASILVLQARKFLRISETERIGRALVRLNELSSWRGGRIKYAVWILSMVTMPLYYEFKLRTGEVAKIQVNIVLTILFYLTLYSEYFVAEFYVQSMKLFENQLNSLSSIAERISEERRGDRGIEELRDLNRRHIFISDLFNDFAKLTGTDHLMIIESKRIVILLNVFRNVNAVKIPEAYLSRELSYSWLLLFDLIIIIRYFYWGQKITTEADRFVRTFDKFYILDFENDENFTEFQIFRKQAKIRKLQYDCNRFLKLDAKQAFLIVRDTVVLAIVLAQLSSSFKIGNTEAVYNATELMKIAEKNFTFVKFLSYSEL